MVAARVVGPGRLRIATCTYVVTYNFSQLRLAPPPSMALFGYFCSQTCILQLLPGPLTKRSLTCSQLTFTLCEACLAWLRGKTAHRPSNRL